MNTEEQVANLRDALQNLYDYQRLRRHRVCALLPQRLPEDSGRAVQAALTEAIERVKPGAEVPATAPAWRYYHILFYRFVQDMSVREVALRLGISARHLKREQNQALATLAEYLQQRLPQTRPGGTPEPAGQVGEIGEEIQRMQSGSALEVVAISPVLSEVVGILEGSFATRRIEVSDRMPEDIPAIGAYRQMFKQALLAAIGFLTWRRTDGTVEFEAEWGTEYGLTLSLSWRPRRESIESGIAAADAETSVTPQAISDLLSSFGGELADPPAQGLGLRMCLPVARQIPVLVVEDNPDTVRLYRRYLAGSVYRMYVAKPDSVRRAIEELQPAAAIVDIMMPGRDGWDVLGELRSDPDTAHLRVLVCSVLSDYGIAASLGATAYRQKPVSQQELLDTLDQLVGSELPSQH